LDLPDNDLPEPGNEPVEVDPDVSLAMAASNAGGFAPLIVSMTELFLMKRNVGMAETEYFLAIS
jgi:hypothetical protein